MIEFLCQPEVIIWILIIIIYAFSKFGFGLGYLSVTDIIRHHVDCFRNTNSKKLMIVPVVDYIIVPFMLGASAAILKIIDSSIVNIITIIVSILTSMLFTLLAMIIDMKSKIKSDPNYYRVEAELSKQSLIETYYTVMFEILVAVILLILCLFNVFTSKFGFMQSLLIYSLTFLLIINLLMIIKRIFRVIDTDMKK